MTIIDWQYLISILKYDMKSYKEMDACQILQISGINKKNKYLKNKESNRNIHTYIHIHKSL